MDAAGGSMIESPITMKPGDIPSPLTYEGPFSLTSGIDMAAVAAAVPRRRPSKGHPGGIVKRSLSTPNVRSLTTGSDAMSLAEKRRNKLGYHRTSVACVHCRRRKIRCLLAPDDAQNRCSNCIRLKKECNFFPVDQQPQIERRPRTGSKAEAKSGAGSTSSSESPSATASHVAELPDSFAQYHSLPQSAYSTGMVPINTSGMSPPGSAAPHSSRFDLSDQSPGTGWDMRFFETHQIPPHHSVNSGDDSGQHTFWKVPETPLTPASYSPYSPAPSTGIHYPHHPWPMRSMSYSHIDEHGPHHLRQESHPDVVYGGGAMDSLRRSTIDMPPPAPPRINTHTSSMGSVGVSPIMGDVAQQSLSAGPVPYHAVPHPWNMLPTQSPKTADFGPTSWYPDPNQLAKVHEDEVSHFGNDMQTGLYSTG